jgi:hypothetical protein
MAKRKTTILALLDTPVVKRFSVWRDRDGKMTVALGKSERHTVTVYHVGTRKVDEVTLIGADHKLTTLDGMEFIKRALANKKAPIISDANRRRLEAAMQFTPGEELVMQTAIPRTPSGKRVRARQFPPGLDPQAKIIRVETVTKRRGWCAMRYAMWQVGMTLSEYIDKGGLMADIVSDLAHNYIELEKQQ